ncbi:MAG: hypothetical protein MUF58_16095 [Arcicella sp.]|jgi:general stress protein CsbA|nr:hypothetical protein [Arcicella sp.]
MNTSRNYLSISQRLLVIIFTRSLFYTFPVGMFLTACNFLFESVKRYYFDWWIVVIPTLLVWVIGLSLELYLIMQERRVKNTSGKLYESKSTTYGMAKSQLVTN